MSSFHSILLNQAAIYKSELNVRGRVWKHGPWTWKICLPSFNETLSWQWGHIKRNALGCLHSFRLKQTLAELMGVRRHFKRRTLWRRLEVHIMGSSLFCAKVHTYCTPRAAAPTNQTSDLPAVQGVPSHSYIVGAGTKHRAWGKRRSALESHVMARSCLCHSGSAL